MRIKSKLAEISGLMAALLIAVIGLAVTATVFSFAKSSQGRYNETGVFIPDTNVTNNTGVVALIGLVGIIFVIIVIYSMVKKVGGGE